MMTIEFRAVKKRGARCSALQARKATMRAPPHEGKIQERYGLAKDQGKKDVEAWFKSLP
jgi:hypothetical protein